MTRFKSHSCLIFSKIDTAGTYFTIIKDIYEKSMGDIKSPGNS
jgi:hypothetical protein